MINALASKKSIRIIQQLLGSSVIFFVGFIQQYYHFYVDIVLLFSTIILWSPYLKASEQQGSITIARLLIIFFIGFSYSIFIHKLSDFMLEGSLLYAIPEFNTPVLLLLTHIMIFWSQLVAKADQQGYDYLVTYAYWPNNPFLRIPSLMANFASNTGLFSMFCINVMILLLKVPFIKNSLLALDLMVYIIFMIVLLGLYGHHIMHPLFSKIMKYQAPYPALILIISWFVAGLALFTLTPYNLCGLNIAYAQAFTAKSLLFLTKPNLSLFPFSIALLLIPVSGNLLYRYRSQTPIMALFLFFGMTAYSYAHPIQHIDSKIIGYCFIALMSINLLIHKSPFHAFDAPFIISKGAGLSPKRWLQHLTFRPMSLLISLMIIPSHYFFVLIQNVGLLMLLGLCYFSLVQLIKPLVSLLKNWYSDILRSTEMMAAGNQS
jgi:hypothetical protein